MGRDLRLGAAGDGQHCHGWLFFLKEFDWGAPECARAVSAARQREKSATIRTSEGGRQEFNNSNNSPRRGSASG
jgi:hypothetical protein